MRAVIQRVLQAKVSVGNEQVSKIGQGLLVFIGIASDDVKEDVDWITNKICALRIFNDEEGLMNRSVVDANGDLMVISQFTLFANTRKGRRPSYIQAAKPEIAYPIYLQTLTAFENALRREISSGRFGADMQVSLTNDGPVTITIDTRNKE